MNRRARLISVGATLLVAAVVSLPLLAQPEPSPKEGPYLLEIPTGEYVNFIFAFSGSTTGKSLRVTIEGPVGPNDTTFLVPPGETVIIPVAAGNKPWRVPRPLLVRVDQPTSRVHASGISSEGPVSFRPTRN